VANARILEYGHPVLRKKAKAVGTITPEVRDLIARMIDSLAEADGLGLAAPQIGVGQRVVIVDLGEGPVVLINPKITSREGEQCGLEGCLSLPRLYADVRRPEKVTVKARDRAGDPITLTGEGLMARAFCHEIDHLDGVLFIDRLEPETLHWATGDTDPEGDLEREYTTLEQALAVFEARLRSRL
jgi:peptide deformylase